MTEKLNANRNKLEAIVKVLFEDLLIPAIYMVMEESLPLYTTSSYTGLIVDCGYSGCRILPIYEGSPVMQGYITLSCGVKDTE